MKSLIKIFLLVLPCAFHAHAANTYNILDKTFYPTTYGTSGQCWTSNGAGIVPSWQACSGGAGGWPTSPAMNGDCTLNTSTGAISCGLADLGTPALYGITYWSSTAGNGTLGNAQITGIVKGGGAGAAPSAAAASDVTALWSGTCNSTTYLRGDGQCQSAAGATTVSLVGKQPVAYSTANSTSEIVVYTQNVGALTANDILRLRFHVTLTGSTNSKTIKAYLTTAGAGAQGATFSCVGTCTGILNAVASTAAVTSAVSEILISNQNATNSQEASGMFLTANGSVGSIASTAPAIQTSTSSVVVVTITKATGTETATIHGAVVEKISDGT